MNPMIGFSWAFYKDSKTWLTAEHVLVYWLAPTVGAVVAAFLWKFVQGIVHGDTPKRKSD
jgi:glycerol uptake facilitator-like aquaporin